MYVTSLQFKNYRNLSGGEILPDKNINVIYGNNAQGKTNILEALWLFGGGHSFRGSKENEFIKFGESFSKIKADFYSQDRDQEAEIVFGGSKKEIIINGVRKNSSSSLIGKYTAVIFSPEDMNLVKRGPSARRRFLDSAICREKIGNAVTVSRYIQTINQRNALLKDIFRHPELKDMLDIWDENLCRLGAEIIHKRLSYISRLSEYAHKYHLGISDGKEKLRLRYFSTCSAEAEDSREEIYEKLKKSLKDNIDDDCKSGYTNIGPQRDDFDIIINGKKAKVFASQGQQRSSVLSLKLAEAEVLSILIGEKPIILLDDVFSELDKSRQEFLLNKISDYQVFITCCDFDENGLLKEGKRFLIVDGKAE